ncbi:MAG: imidazole glycerol phosphate synthase subunit HisH [Proteobacteria bacterium]|nr:imidazole glycerol phosphate synthase subunit HisH [Pseudomonadota bacterium]
MSVAIVDYGSGNLHSAQKAFERMARERGLNAPVLVTADPDLVRKADRIVLPGVGAFADCKRGLVGVPGMVEAMTEAVRGRGRPFLGICVGMQLMGGRGLEKETSAGLGWVPGDIDLIRPTGANYKIPHMGWNTLNVKRDHAVLAGIPTGPDGLHAYFVHSYHLTATADDVILADADYGTPVTAMIARDTMVGTQFHPEKSQKLGLTLIGNFLEWRP